ncbi:protein kinase family protein [Bacillus sp. FJAT-49736]|uniref:serine/threonine protein kinase n=1 Tax=Bacillus sp. FJAT-49736 TaxID=2833582 RepID=UPI001BC9A03D|nr:protein kinase family protein [Bacillus sp. FJAT-49736]MBS4175757.1 protein kinase family protein [Bacillus sp. FJAT-49736]
MMNNTLKNQYRFQSGTVITGKWNKNHYTLIRELGSGANGVVYLAEGRQGYIALKMSNDTMSITSEVNVLKSFSKVQGSTLGPSLLEIDDWEKQGKRVPFYVMEYIHGPDLLTFIQKKGHAWTGVLMLQLLKDLESLHREGWVFGDLKPENLIVTGPPTRIRCIDVGGTTLLGRAIKEYTEFFDRGYWQAGSRKAEPSYDLFAVAMVMINLYYPRRFSKQGTGLGQLKKVIREKPELAKYQDILCKAISSKYKSAIEMREDLLKILSSSDGDTQRNHYVNLSTSKTRKPVSRVKRRKYNKIAGLLETIMIILVISFLYILYVYGHLM